MEPYRSLGGQASGASSAKSAGPLRKRTKALGLEEQVRMLEDENRALRLQLKVGKESAKQDEEKKDDIVAQILELLQKPDHVGERERLRSLLKSYIVRYSDWGPDYVDTVDNHMVTIKKLLTPTKVTKLCLWALNQDDDFFKPTLSPHESMFQILGEVVEGTLDQTEEFKNYRTNAKLLARGLRFSDRECDDLRERLHRKNRALAEEMHEMQNILNPEQLAKLIVWANKNQNLGKTLEKEWVGWTDPKVEEDRTRERREREDKRSVPTNESVASAPDDDGDEDDDDDDGMD